MGLLPAELKLIFGARLEEIASRQEAEEHATRQLASAKASDVRDADAAIAGVLESETRTDPRLQ